MSISVKVNFESQSVTNVGRVEISSIGGPIPSPNLYFERNILDRSRIELGFSGPTTFRLLGTVVLGQTWIYKYEIIEGPENGTSTQDVGGDLQGQLPNPQVIGIRGNNISADPPVDGNMLLFNSGEWEPGNLDGDVVGNADNTIVSGIRGVEVSSEQPTNRDILVYSAESGRFELERLSTVPALSSTQYVYVSESGSDESGDGTINNPYRNVSRALSDCPDNFIGTIAFVVRIIAPYTGPGFTYECGVKSVGETGFGVIAIESWAPENVNEISDPRFIEEQVVVALSGEQTNQFSPVIYRVPQGSVSDSQSGKIVRIFRNGVEVGRGILGGVLIGDNDDTIYVVHRHPTSNVPWSQQAGDEIRICDLSVNLTSQIRISASTGVLVHLTGIRAISSGQTLFLLGGQIRTQMCRFIATTANGAAMMLSPLSIIQSVYSSASLFWMDPTDAILTNFCGQYIGNTHSSETKIGLWVNTGFAAPIGSVIEGQVLIGLDGFYAMNTNFIRGHVFSTDGTISIAFGVVFWGRPDQPINRPCMDLLLTKISQGSRSNGVHIWYYDSGWNPNFPIALMESCNVVNTLRFRSVNGSVTLNGPVYELTNGNYKIAGAEVVGGTHDITLGSVNINFSDIPEVDVPTLTRVV